MKHWGLSASRVKPLISYNKYATSCMFAEQTLYVNELCLTDVQESERHTYSFDAHAIEHVENILCCNISRWALSVWATSQASYCGIDHTDPHLQKHTQTHSAPPLRYCPGTAVQSGCSALFRLCFSAVGEKLWPLRGWVGTAEGQLTHSLRRRATWLWLQWFETILNRRCISLHLAPQRNVEKRAFTTHLAEDMCTCCKEGPNFELTYWQRAKEHQRQEYKCFSVLPTWAQTVLWVDDRN